MTAPRHKVCIVASGTQGEPMSALSRVAVDNHKNLSRGDRAIRWCSARASFPGNEKAIGRMMNHMARRGADIDLRQHESAGARVGSRQCGGTEAGAEPGSAALLHSDPRRISADGEARATCAASAERRAGGDVRAGDRRNGRDRPRGARMGPKVPVGRVCIDSGSLDEVVEDIVIRDRRHLSEDGFVLPDHRDQQAHRQERESAGDRIARLRFDGRRASSCRKPGRWWRGRSRRPARKSGPIGA